MSQDSSEVRAVVRGVFRKAGGAVPYAATEPVDPDLPRSVTFSLVPGVWSEPDDPAQGQMVYLSGIYPAEQGARARAARPVPLGENTRTQGAKQ